MTDAALTLRNNGMKPLCAATPLHADDFTDNLAGLMESGQRVCAYFGDRQDSGETALFAVCADDRSGTLSLLISSPCRGKFRSLTPRHPQVHLFEREIWEQTGLIPEGHPWLKPVRFPSAPPCGSLPGISET